MIGKKRKRTESESVVEDKVSPAGKKPKTVHAGTFARTWETVKPVEEATDITEKKSEMCNDEQGKESLPVEKVVPAASGQENFCVHTFIRGLQGPECLQALKAFAKEAKGESDSGNDVVGKFLAAGGSPEDVLRVVNTSEKKNLVVPALAFSVVRLIIMRILRDMPEQTVLAESACSFFIRAHLPIIHSMLSLASETQPRISALRLLSLVVTVSPELAQEVARNVTLSPPALMTLARRSQRKGKTNVRTCFIHFLLSFLVNGSGGTCRLLLEKKGYLNSIIPGLIQDGADTVVLVLTTLREKVLENPAISKTVKVHVFNVPTIGSLAALYNWKGPQYVMTNPWKKKRSAVEIIQAEPDGEEKELVAETAHELLLKLCSSTKHGIVFQDQSLGTSGVKHNPIMYGVLQGLERPWENKWTCDLALKLLKACPDLVRTVWPLMENFLVPRASQKWLDAMSFVEQILLGFDPEVSLKHNTTAFTEQQLCSLLLAFSTPAPVLKVVCARGLEHSHLTVRNRTAGLLCAVLSLLQGRLEMARGWGLVLPADRVAAFLAQHLPAPRLIYAAWGGKSAPRADEGEAEEILPAPAAGAHESAILELLLLYRRCCPQLLDAAEFGQEFGDLLPGVLALERDGEGTVARLQVKAVRLLSSVDSQAFSPDKELFVDAGFLLFDLLGCDQEDVRRDAASALASLFESTGLFEMASQELQVWLHCYRVVEPDKRAHVARFLLNTVRDLSAHVELHVSRMRRAEEAAALTLMATREVNVDAVENILQGLMEKGHVKRRGNRLSCESLSPLLVATLHADLDDVTTNFLSYVVVHLLHTQVSPSLLLEVVRLTPEGRLPDSLWRYLEGWAGAGNPLPLKKPFPQGSPTRRLSEKILRPDSEDRKPFAKADKALLENLESGDILGMVGQAVFYATQLAAKGRLTPAAQHKCTEALKTLLVRAEDSGLLEACLEKVLCSPAVVRGFDPLAVGDSRSLSQVAVSVIRFASSRQERLPGFTSLLEPLKDKFVACLTRRSATAPVTVDLEILTEAFRLSREDVLSLLEACSALNWTVKSSGWGQLLAYLLREAAKLGMGDLEGSTLKALVDQMAKAELGEKTLVEPLEVALTEFLRRCPHLVGSVPADFFESVLVSGSSRVSTARMLTLLIRHDRTLVARFRAVVLAREEEVVGNETLFPCLFAEYVKGVKAGERDEAFARVCDVTRVTYGGELNRFLKKPEKVKDWMLQSFPAVESMIDECFDISTFSKMKPSVFENIRNTDTVNKLYLDTVERICARLDASSRAELVGALLESTAKLTKEGRDPESLLHLTGMLSRRMAWAGGGELKNYPAFCDVALKFGLRCEDRFQGELLALLPDFCNLMAVDGADDPSTRTVFEKLISHSRFLDLILGKSDSKSDVLRLLLVLVKKVPSVMSTDHVPLLLGAYGASLSAADQLVLQLLQTYESSGVTLKSCQPYLWGEAAVNYYCVRNRAGPSLWNRPHAGQVLDLLDAGYVEWTVTKFPYERGLQASSTVPADPELYDPAFLLPLLSHILAPESPVPNYKVMQSGAMAMVLSALGSRSKETRAAACHVLARFHGHLQGSRSAKLWLQFLEAVRGGVVKLAGGGGEGAAPEVPELSCVVATFLARTSLIIMQPAHPMYLPLHNFVLAKPAMDLSIVPEFLVLFHSSTLDHKTHRHWILEVLRDGIQYWKDVALCLHCVLYKMIMDFHSSSLADTRTKVLCLAILESTVRIPKAAQLLVRSYSIVPWLAHSVNQLEGSEVALRAAMLDAVATLASSLEGQDAATLPMLLVLLVPHLERSVTSVLKFLSALRTLARERPSALAREDVDSVVRICGEVLGSVGDCDALLRYGTDFSDPNPVPVPGPGVTDSESALRLLRDTISCWLKGAGESLVVAEDDGCRADL